MTKYTTVLVFILLAFSIFFYIFFSSKKNSDEAWVPPTSSSTPQTMYESATTTTYVNSQYGFSLTLPLSWKNYSVVESDIEYGHKIVLRNPAWATSTPLMDIPVLVYPIQQWNIWETNNFEGYPTAAPIGPTKRGQNTAYVFATAPRYNFSFLPGFEEVEKIIQTITAK